MKTRSANYLLLRDISEYPLLYSKPMHGEKVAAQRIYGICRDEKEDRTLLKNAWNEPLIAKEVSFETLDRNVNMFQFEMTMTR